MNQQNNFPANEVKIQGVFSLKQVTPTFQKQVLLIKAKDTRDQQWKDAELEIYIKPDIMTAAAIQPGDTIIVEGWIAFNFANNGMSFPRIVATNAIKIAAQNNQANPQPQPTTQINQSSNSNFNNPQTVQQLSQQTTMETAPELPNVPNIPTM